MNPDVEIFNASTNHDNGSDYDISLIICTRNREKKLTDCLDKISRIAVKKRWELIIIDNDSSDNTREVIRNFSRKVLFPITYSIEREKGTGAARNLGANLSSSNFLIYIDDDCYPSATLLDDYYDIFSNEKSLDFVAGRVELYDVTDLPLTIITSQEVTYFSPKQRISAGQVISANLAIKKETLNRIGGWDIKFGAGTKFPCEDLDVVARILCNGGTGKYDPRPFVNHHHGRKTACDYKGIMSSYDAGRGGFYGKCLTDPLLRKTYIWPWIKSIFKRRDTQSCTEIKYALIYICERVFS